MIDSRNIQKQLQNLKKKMILIDIREFRSNLPFLLYSSHSFQIIPKTITVGDYIVALEICIERKGISDLFQSFNSGRLYNQIEAMCKYYKFPCLLIEFNIEKSFCLVVSLS